MYLSFIIDYLWAQKYNPLLGDNVGTAIYDRKMTKGAVVQDAHGRI